MPTEIEWVDALTKIECTVESSSSVTCRVLSKISIHFYYLVLTPTFSKDDLTFLSLTSTPALCCICLFHNPQCGNFVKIHIINFSENSTSNGITGRICTYFIYKIPEIH